MRKFLKDKFYKNVVRLINYCVIYGSDCWEVNPRIELSSYECCGIRMLKWISRVMREEIREIYKG